MLIGTHLFRAWSHAPQLPIPSFSFSTPSHLSQAKGRPSRRAQRRAQVRTPSRLFHRHHPPALPSWHRVQWQQHFEMVPLSAQTSTRESVTRRELLVQRACTSVRGWVGAAGPVECPSMERTPVVTLDGAPRMIRWHHLDKQVTAIVTTQMSII